MLSRWQKGSVYRTGKRPVWYGRFREDLRTPDGNIVRKMRKVRLGTLAEIPTRAAAREALSQHMVRPSKPKTQMTFQALVEEWQRLEMPTIEKSSTRGHYQNALRTVLPEFGTREIATITRYEVQQFLKNASARYSRNTLRSLRIAMSIVFEWAISLKWLDENPCSKVKLPCDCGGRRVKREVLTCDQVVSIISRLEEPYATLVLLLSVTGLRIGEAVAIKWSDFEGDVLKVQRRIYDGEVDSVKSEKSNRKLPIPHVLLKRMRALGDGEWVFRSRTGTAVDPKNALNRKLRGHEGVLTKLGIKIGGWHDFRHTLTTNLRQYGVHPKVVSGVLGHSNVELALNVYDHLEAEEMREPLTQIAERLCPDVPKAQLTT